MVFLLSIHKPASGNKVLTYTTMKGGVLAVDHLRTLVFRVVIAEALCLTLTSLLTSRSTHGSRFVVYLKQCIC